MNVFSPSHVISRGFPFGFVVGSAVAAAIGEAVMDEVEGVESGNAGSFAADGATCAVPGLGVSTAGNSGRGRS